MLENNMKSVYKCENLMSKTFYKVFILKTGKAHWTTYQFHLNLD